jgi:hypothetical protein
MLSVQIQFPFALIAFYHAAKNLIAAFWTYIAGLFVSNPFFSSEFSSIRDRPQNDFLTNGHGEIIDVLARKITALVTTCVTFFVGACPDRTLLAMHEKII